MEEEHVPSNMKLIIIMVGLPARGKSYITKKLARYLNWLQLETRIFNVGERRRATDVCKPNGAPVLDTASLTQHVSICFVLSTSAKTS